MTSVLHDFANIKRDVLNLIHFVFERVENLVGKGGNALYQFFLLLPQCFQKCYSGLFILRIVW